MVDEAAAESSDVPPGTILAARYRIERKLGEGGMGAVYLAEHVHMRKRFALKLLHEKAMRDPEIVARFEREAVAAGNIEHPNVAKATDFGKLADGRFFLVLELVEGQSLRDALGLGAIAPARALVIARQILEGLDVAHRLGFVHRDIKPENVMLVAAADPRDGVGVKILDFGLARADVHLPAPNAPQLTRAGIIFGTPSYMAPEQALAQPVDGRADLYSVGVVLFEMISGKKPFQGDPLEIIGKHVAMAPPPLTSPHGVITSELRALVGALLAKTRDERPADAVAALRLVDTAIASLSTDAPQRVVIAPPSAPRPPIAAPPLSARARTIALRGKHAVEGGLDAIAAKTGVPLVHVRRIALGVAVVVAVLLVYFVVRPRSHLVPDASSTSAQVAPKPEKSSVPPTPTPTSTIDMLDESPPPKTAAKSAGTSHKIVSKFR